MADPFSYTVVPTLGGTPDPLDAARRDLESLRMRIPKDFKYDFAAEDVVTPRVLVEGADAIVQRVIFRLRFVQGEWFLDTRLGVPYLQRVLVFNPNIQAITQLFSSVILSVPGVKGVRGLLLTLDKAARRLRVSDFTIIVGDGTGLKLDKDFIV